MSSNETEVQAEEANDAKAIRVLGVLGIIGAPLLTAGWLFLYGGPNASVLNQFLMNFVGVVYLAGIGANVIGMRRLRVTGRGRGATILFGVQMIGLVLAMGFNALEFVAPQLRGTTVFFICDMAYPFSHTVFIVVGFAVLKAGVWRGWRVAGPFIAGLALPSFFLGMAVLGRDSSGVFFMAGTTIGFLLTGLAIITSRRLPALQVPLESPQPQY